MPMYAIAYLNYLDNVNTVKIVEANSELEALRNVLDIPHKEFKSMEDLMEFCFNADLNVSVPFSLDEMLLSMK